MPDKQLKLSPEEQVSFFLPILENYIKDLASALSKAKKSDYENAEWLIILPNHKSGNFLNFHYFSEAWEDISAFLRKQKKLYFFLDEKDQVLVEKTAKFWLFFSPSEAAAFFAAEPSKPSGFGPQTIKPAPFPDLLTPFQEHIEATLSISLSSNVKTLEKITELISIADYFLETETLNKFDIFTKKAVTDTLLSEIDKLKKDISSPAVSVSLIKKRLRLSLIISWRYFRAKNELETNYFKKLLSEDNDARLKGLNLASKKISDYQSSL